MTTEQSNAVCEPRTAAGGLAGARRVALFVAVALGTTVLDQASKYAVFHAVPLGVKSTELIPGVLWLSHVYNKGVAWGMLAGHPGIVTTVAMATALGVLACGLVGRFAWPSYVAGLAAVFGGAVGNLLDRAFRPEGVLDFLDLGWWPQFNVADAAVVVGAISVGVAILRATAIEERAARAAVAQPEVATSED